MKKLLIPVAAALLLLSACGGTPSGRVCLFAVDPAGDRYTNTLAYGGLKDAEAMGYASAVYVEVPSAEDGFGYAVASMERGNNNIFIGLGAEFSGVFEELAAANRDRQYILIGSEASPEVQAGGNLVSVIFSVEEAAYIGGYIAAESSRTGCVGLVLGPPSAENEALAAGFCAGAYAADPGVRVVGRYAASYAVRNEGKRLALEAGSEGADVIFAPGGKLGRGVHDAAEEYELRIVSYGRPEPGQRLTEDQIIYYVEVEMAAKIAELVKMASEASRPFSETIVYNYGNGGLTATMAEFRVREDILGQADLLREGIAAGEILVPRDFDGLADMGISADSSVIF